MNKPIIKDLTPPPAETKNLKPIEIKGCLQASKLKESQNGLSCYYFSENFTQSACKSMLTSAETITRLTRANVDSYKYDLINVDGNVWWGFWNDGVLPE